MCEYKWENILFGSNIRRIAPAILAQERLTMNSKPSLDTRVTYSVGGFDSAMVEYVVVEGTEARVEWDLEKAKPQAEIASSGDMANKRNL
jgi:hypothetical protein